MMPPKRPVLNFIGGRAVWPELTMSSPNGVLNDHSSSAHAFQIRADRRSVGRPCCDYPWARATQGVISLDIASDLLDPDSFVATGIYEDGAALERQESALEVRRAMAMFAEALAAPPDRTIYDASRDPSLI